ncbi:MAG: GFA family protein [Oscillospiraceae bacterium]|nr:GFA family protein [Oscillospiraceae bacterium]
MFVYACHCDDCRRMNAGPVMSVDPGPKENVEFVRGEGKITIYHDDEIERGFCSVCGGKRKFRSSKCGHYGRKITT